MAEIQGGDTFISCIPRTRCSLHFELLDAFTLCRQNRGGKNYHPIVTAWKHFFFHIKLNVNKLSRPCNSLFFNCVILLGK